MVDLRLALPIAHISQLSQQMEFREIMRLLNMGDLILDTIEETIIEVVLESTFAIAPDLYSNLVELYNTLVNALTILHGQVVKLMFCISNRVI